MRFEGMHAVIIEDNEINAQVLSNLLSRDGISCTIFESGAELERGMIGLPSIQIIFLDLEMTHLNGYEILTMLGAQGWTNRVPIVACTSHISHVNTARIAGFHSFLGKPLRRDQFRDHLERILAGESVWDIP